MQPLILSLVLDDAAQEEFDGLRRAHFPADRLVVGAHVTLFHALPPEREEQVRADLAEAAEREPFGVAVTGVRSLGRGVAYGLASDELAGLHRDLHRAWQPWLSRQDDRRLAAHVTVQNKVTPDRARALLARLSASFVPYEVRAEGLAMWRYAGGPWEPVERYRFSGRRPAMPRS